MTDSAKNIPSPAPAAGKQTKNPLDILEDVLADAKNATQNKQADADTEAEAEAEKEKQQQAELAKLREQKLAEDAAHIKDQLHQMQEIIQTPAEQARLAQEQEEESEFNKKKSDQEGYEIRQLGHSKV